MTVGGAPFLCVMRCVVVALAMMPVLPKSYAQEDPVIHTGDCTLKENTETNGETIQANFELCMNGRAGSQISFVSGNSKENFATAYANGALGVHMTQYISFFGEGFARRRAPLGEDVSELTERDSDLMVMRVGVPSIHGFALTSGKFRAPFGIGINDASESYKFFADDYHWSTYDYGHWFSWDDLKNFFIDLSYVSETLPGKRVETDPGMTREPDWGGSVRVGYDFSAIEGSRLVGSAYAENSGMRRSGIGFISVNSRGDTNWIEFVRTRTSPDGQLTPFRQVLKFGYLSSWRSGSRWSVLIEEDRNLQRIGEFVHHISIFGYGQVNVGLLMRRTLETPYQDRWHVTSGLEVTF